MAKSCDKDNSCVEEENAWDYLPEEEVRTVKPLHQRLDYLQEEEVPTVKTLASAPYEPQSHTLQRQCMALTIPWTCSATQPKSLSKRVKDPPPEDNAWDESPLDY